MAQNIPERLTVSLQATHTTQCIAPPYLHALDKLSTSSHCSPAMYNNGLVACAHLYFDDIINHVSHSLDVRAAAIRCPVGDVELGHLMSLVSLGGEGG